MPDDKMCALHTERIHDIEKRQIAMEGTVNHIKERIDNGMGKTINGIATKINEFVVPTVSDNAYWVGKIKWGVFWVAVIGVGGGLAKVLINWVQ